MRRGDGTLVLLSRAGALEAGCPPRRAPRAARAQHLGARKRLRLGQRVA
jgi:hypothetical protein